MIDSTGQLRHVQQGRMCRSSNWQCVTQCLGEYDETGCMGPGQSLQGDRLLKDAHRRLDADPLITWLDAALIDAAW